MNNDDLPTKKPANSLASQNGRVFDVVRPGKVLASPTSRPVIVSHKPIAPDDQFVAPADRQLMEHKQPVSLPSPSVSEQPDTPAEVAPAMTEPAETKSEQPTAPVAPAPDKPTPESVAVGQTVSVPVDAVSPAPAPALPHDSPMDRAIALADDKLLSDSSAPLLDQAFVSQHAPPKKKGKKLILIIVVVVVLLIVLDLLLDTKILKLGGIPHTHFIG